MTQVDLQKAQKMSPSEMCVDQASNWAVTLTAWERARGEDDPVAAVARRARVSRYAIWSLVYRPPKRVGAEIYLALGGLYERGCATQAERYAAERDGTKAQTRLGRALLGAVDALVGPED